MIRLKKKLYSQPSKPLIVFGWTYIFLVFALVVSVCLFNQQIQKDLRVYGESKAVTYPVPRIGKLIVPDKAQPGDEVIIQGGKFGSRGQVCFRYLSEPEDYLTCFHPFEILVWTAGLIRTRIPFLATGEGELWVIMGEGIRSNQLAFFIE